jgi:tRNA (mo5U34)-methyltransferase
VLDIGAWDGFFSFEAERRGASRVEDVDIDVLDLRPERVGGTFDVVFFLGVLYHLPNPLLALERVASVASDLLILETVVDMVGVRRPTAAFYPGRELNDDPTNWWGPNEAAVHGMLRAVGFEDVRTVTPLPSAPYRAARAVSHWMRGKNTLRGAFRQDRAVFHARRSGRQA